MHHFKDYESSDFCVRYYVRVKPESQRKVLIEHRHSPKFQAKVHSVSYRSVTGQFRRTVSQRQLKSALV